MSIQIPGVVHTEIDRHLDRRGFFNEVFRTSGMSREPVQANHSHSQRGALRGLHYHKRQADLWYVMRGRIRIGLADLRTPGVDPSTANFEMSSDSPATLLIPPGVAHGFLALTTCDFIYFVTQQYDASDEFGIAWDDHSIGIKWGVTDPVLSERDRSNPRFSWDDIPSFS